MTSGIGRVDPHQLIATETEDNAHTRKGTSFHLLSPVTCLKSVSKGEKINLFQPITNSAIFRFDYYLYQRLRQIVESFYWLWLTAPVSRHLWRETRKGSAVPG